MRKLVYLFIYIAALVMAAGCGGGKKPSYDKTIFVSIAPIKPLVEAIVGDEFTVEVLVPAGASPETFELTAKQFVALNESVMVCGTGLLDFERSLLERIYDQSKVINLSVGIDVIAGSCSHTHHGHKCTHGIDPHIWCSPKSLSVMAKNIYNALVAAMPERDFQAGYTALNERINRLDADVTQLCSEASLPYFIIYHPALTYIARDYNLEQVAIEAEGKEPSAKRIAQIIERARRDGIKRVFYQSEFPQSSVAVVAEDIGANAVEINPLDENVFDSILAMVTLITE